MFSISNILMVLGSLFILLSAIGLLRLTSLFNKVHAATKTTTFGTMLIIAGLIIEKPEWTSRLLIILVFIILTNPVSSHAIARSAFKK